MMAAITHHAAQRYVERVDPRATTEEARVTLLGFATVIDIAADFGADTIILGCGARLKLVGDVVATVYASRHVVRRRRPNHFTGGN